MEGKVRGKSQLWRQGLWVEVGTSRSFAHSLVGREDSYI